MNFPKVSIIVPAYNSADTIERCVRSIIDQSFKDWELIIVDNGSKDSTVDVVNTLCGRDNRIILLEESKKGVSNARNSGLDVAKGEFICFVDSDDYIDKDYLDILCRYENVDLVVCGYCVDHINNLGEILLTQEYKPDNITWSDILDKSHLAGSFELGFMHFCWNKLFRRTIIADQKLRFKPVVINEDYIFVLQYLLNVSKLQIISKSLYHWIRVSNTTTGVNSIPQNLLSIYNESHQLTRDFFQDNAIADKIAFYSYEMIVYKYYDAFSKGKISKGEMYAKLNELCRDSLVQESFESYIPVSKANKLLVGLLAKRHYRIHYFLTQKLLKIFCI